MVKNLPAVWEVWVRPLSQEDPLEKGMATHSSILAWRIPRREKPGGLQSMGLQRVKYDRATSTFIYIHTHILTHMHVTPFWTSFTFRSPQSIK